MNRIPLPLQLYVPLLLACLGVALLLALSVGVVRSAARAVQGFRLRQLRMSDMLDMRDIDHRVYLKLTPLPELRRQLSNCVHCRNQRQCDEQLLAGEVYGTGFAYCPNTPALNALLQRTRETPEVCRV